MEKREAALFRAAAQQCSAAPEECTLFDDSPVACRGAKEAGLHVVGVFDSIFCARRRCDARFVRYLHLRLFRTSILKATACPQNRKINQKFDPAGHIIGQPGFLDTVKRSTLILRPVRIYIQR